ncbi:hypothetical protein HMI56_001945 [Coelomomyces lativittatus]|nr:hypothetical protein HMI56_001945 [Coelomomyces lativittatus]
MPKPDIALYSLEGRKHRQFQLNEDRVYEFDFDITLGPYTLPVLVACLTDGHGARPRSHPSEEDLKNTHQGLYKTPGDWFCSLVQQELPHLVLKVCQLDPTLTQLYLCQNNTALESTVVLDTVLHHLQQSISLSFMEENGGSHSTSGTSLGDTSSSKTNEEATHPNLHPVSSKEHRFHLMNFYLSTEFHTYLSKVHHLFTHFREIVNQHVNEIAPHVCHGAGSTLCMGVHLGPVLFTINIGDSTMFFWNDTSQTIPHVWSIDPLLYPCCTQLPLNVKPLPKVTSFPPSTSSHPPSLSSQSSSDSTPTPTPTTTYHPCSYEDTVVDFPHVIKEGQVYGVVERDFLYVKPNLKPNRTAHTLCSPYSNKNLRMINTLGNMGHRHVLVPRTTVYVFPILRTTTPTPPHTSPLLSLPSNWFIMVSDGITDLLPVSILPLFFKIQQPMDLLSFLTHLSTHTNAHPNPTSNPNSTSNTTYPSFSTRLHPPSSSILSRFSHVSPLQLQDSHTFHSLLTQCASWWAPFEQLDDVSLEAIQHIVTLFQPWFTTSPSSSLSNPLHPPSSFHVQGTYNHALLLDKERALFDPSLFLSLFFFYSYFFLFTFFLVSFSST